MVGDGGLGKAEQLGEVADAGLGGFSTGLYREGETDGLPEEAVLASLGCGNPLAVGDLPLPDQAVDVVISNCVVTFTHEAVPGMDSAIIRAVRPALAGSGDGRQARSEAPDAIG